jgi:hypothetical protein
MSDSRARATLEVTMSSFPSSRIAAAVSRLVSEFCRSLVDDDDDVVSRFHMAAQELAENLVKYSSGPMVSISAELISGDETAVLRLQAKNQSSSEQLEAVEQRLKELKNAQDPVELYDRLICESAPHDDVSGLGLARIRAEAELEVDYAIEGNELTIAVHATVRPHGGMWHVDG